MFAVLLGKLVVNGVNFVVEGEPDTVFDESDLLKALVSEELLEKNTPEEQIKNILGENLVSIFSLSCNKDYCQILQNEDVAKFVAKNVHGTVVNLSTPA